MKMKYRLLTYRPINTGLHVQLNLTSMCCVGLCNMRDKGELHPR